MICLDSSFIIDYLRGNKDAMAAYEAYDDDELCITECALFEVATGCFYRMKLTRKNDELLKFVDFVSNFNILPMMNLFAFEAAAHYARLKSLGKPVEIADCLAIGVMKSNGVTRILTRNKKHFSRFKGVEVIAY